MIENLPSDGAVQETLFAVYAEPPWLLHLSGELDLCSAPALTIALEGPTKRGGTIGLDLAELNYMDSTDIHVILNAVSLLGDRGRVVLFNPSPLVRRLIEICGLVGTIDINDDPPRLQIRFEESPRMTSHVSSSHRSSGASGVSLLPDPRVVESGFLTARVFRSRVRRAA
jgi:anti-anti-sigma factor